MRVVSNNIKVFKWSNARSSKTFKQYKKAYFTMFLLAVGGNYHCLVSFWNIHKSNYLSKLSQGQSEQYINIYYDEVSKQPWSKTSIAAFRWQMQLCSRALQHAILMYALLPLFFSYFSLSLHCAQTIEPNVTQLFSLLSIAAKWTLLLFDSYRSVVGDHQS